MAHIEINAPHPDKRPPASQIIVNGVDLSMEVFAKGVEIVEVGEGEHTAVGLRCTIGVTDLHINGERIALTDNVTDAAEHLATLLAQNEEAGR